MDKRYLTNGEVNFKFLNRVMFGLVGDATEEEHELAITLRLSGELAVRKRLGLLTEAELDQSRRAAEMALAYRAYLDDRRARHSAWGRGRRTETARI